MDVEKATQRGRVECSLTSVRKWEKEESQGSKGALVREVGKNQALTGPRMLSLINSLGSEQ